jgi:uncharacterized protein YdhG (YjbR/CyaY superfamily)
MAAPSQKFTTIEEYILAHPEPVQKIIEELRQTIKEAAPLAEELISYNMPAYKQNGFLVSFAAWKKHVGMYPTPAGDEHFQKAISAYKSDKATLKFPLNKPMPLELIGQFVRFRLGEMENKT